MVVMRMTKKLVLLLVLVSMVFLVWKFNSKEKEIDGERLGVSSIPEQTSAPSGSQLGTVWFKVGDLDNLFLFPNFDERLELEEIINKYGCLSLINAGFYDENNSPIGLFITEEKLLSKFATNATFNGYFSLTKSGKVSIGFYYPDEPLRLGLQSGPMLIHDGAVRELKLKNDKSARRMVAVLTEKGELYFIAFYKKESVFQGPYLADLAEMVSELEDEIGPIKEAINLDGGAASAFYSEDIKLSELTLIGSFFCLK